MDGLDGRGLEERELAAGEAEPVLDVAGVLVASDPAHVGAYDDALREGFEHRHAEPPAQLRVGLRGSRRGGTPSPCIRSTDPC